MGPNKVKFLCSHGGKILPRPTDNQMKYVGGETRIVAVQQDVTYNDLMKKLCVLFEGDIVLKYQLASEDLESLVSVRSDEELKYMFEEYQRQVRAGMSKLRAFLFPANPFVVDTYSTPADTHALEQRYIDAINGIVRKHSRNRDTSPKPTLFNVSSTCSSPKSVSADQQLDMMSPDSMSVHSYQTARGLNRLHKVHSSPSLHNVSVGSNSCTNMSHPRQPHHGRSPSLPPPPINVPKVVLPRGRKSFSGEYTTVRYQRGCDDTGFFKGSIAVYEKE